MSEVVKHSIDAAKIWLGDFFDTQTRSEVEKLLQGDEKELVDRFYKNMEFGTGGMRGIMGIGSNRVNKYTLGKSTQGLSNYIKETYPDDDCKVVIAYDCRHNSDTLARTVAEVFAANGIKVYLFSELRTTPELSFAVRHLKCHAGIVLTASHNPPEYNGYKVYWTDGGQIVPPQDKEIIAEINKLSFSDINFNADSSLIQLIDKEIDEPFFTQSTDKGTFDVAEREKLKIVFTSLHGTSITAIPEVLKRAGYTDITVIEEQAKPDGNFPTVKSPNPEEPEALHMAIQKAEEIGADIVIGTDPDSDRLGVAVRNSGGKMKILNGNQAMVIMTEFLLENRKAKGFKGKEYIASTIVSTPMMVTLAEHFNVEIKISLTGFKWIAKMIKDFPHLDFVGGGEESYGFMVGDFVRDKDAVTSTLLACEIAAKAKANNSTLFSQLIDGYHKYGFYKERLVSMVKKGMDGAQEIKNMMSSLRQNPWQSMAHSPVIKIDDFSTSISTNPSNNQKTRINIPKSNVLRFTTEDGTVVSARPSGTEPKIKFYISVNSELDRKENYAKINQKLEDKIDLIIKELGLD